ncbi:MAG: alpha/beta fold hydrolase [Spirochaetia bacterium]|nr:alpha/beta fold hydrolase [Spirochaetia bacterium]
MDWIKIKRPGRRILIVFNAYLILLLFSNIFEYEFAEHSFQILKNKMQNRRAVLVQNKNERMRISFVDRGNGHAILFLHGSPGSADNFSLLIPHFSHHRIIVPDLPGYGSSSKWTGDYGLKSNAEIMIELMNVLGIDQFHIVSYSFGSGIALYMARMHPERVRSLFIYGGIGMQETEGSGDYYLEHIKYAFGYAAVVVLPEMIPHFGFMGSRSFRHAFIRNFWDSDQREISSFIQTIRTKTYILHARDDILVHAFAAREHHRFIKNSRMVMLESGNHFLPFYKEGAKIFYSHIDGFIRDVEKNQVFVRTSKDIPDENSIVPLEIDITRKNPYLTMSALTSATFVSEDLTCITSGLLVRDKKIDIFVAVLGCFLGIFFGDMGLWIFGRLLASPLRRMKWFQNSMIMKQTEQMGYWFSQNTGKAVFFSRFIPGTRFITFTGAGFAGAKAWRFMLWAMAAAFLWTPLLVILSALLGPVLTEPLLLYFDSGWIVFLLVLVFLYFILSFLFSGLTQEGRFRMKIFMLKLFQREYWPSWTLYLPLFFYAVYLSIRFNGLRLYLLANPGIEYSGIVGESRSEILSKIKSEFISPFIMVSLKDGFNSDQKSPFHKETWIKNILREMEKKKIDFPAVIKPEVSERGVGFRLIQSAEKLRDYMDGAEEDFEIQKYHPGPFEVGILYYRYPGEQNGKIFSITDKKFPVIEGDGISSLKHLIRTHRRFRMQYNVFEKRHAKQLHRIPGPGQKILLSHAGNHCQGTMFREGSYMITKDLERQMDRIAKTFPGFYIGRFDVRYSDTEQFMKGRDFEIIELNGVLGESTNLYDPDYSYFKAFHIYRKHLQIIFRIGEINRSRGIRPDKIYGLIRNIAKHFAGRKISKISD